MTPLYGIASFYDVGFGARAVSRKTPIYFILINFCKQIKLFFLYRNKEQAAVEWPKYFMTDPI